jgi:hypothetical protein
LQIDFDPSGIAVIEMIDDLNRHAYTEHLQWKYFSNQPGLPRTILRGIASAFKLRLRHPPTAGGTMISI